MRAKTAKSPATKRGTAKTNGHVSKRNGTRSTPKRKPRTNEPEIIVASVVTEVTAAPAAQEPTVVDLRQPVEALDERAEAIRSMLELSGANRAFGDTGIPALPIEAKDRLARYLNEAWAAEKMLVDSLQSMRDEANSPEFDAVLQEHRAVTDRQRLDLGDEVRKFGFEPSSGRGIFSQIISWIGDALKTKPKDNGDRMLQNVLKAYAIEHLEMAMYEAIFVCATLVKEDGVAELAAQHLQEERDAAELLRPLIGQAAERAMALPESAS